MGIQHIQSLELLFHKVAKLHSNTVHSLLSGKDVYPGQPPLLRALAERDGQSQKELAETMQITPATLTVMLGRMEKTGLVERKPDVTDQRISRVYITAKGHQGLLGVNETMQLMEETCFAMFTTEEKIIFRRLLLQMYDNLNHADFKHLVD
ncbi:MarR family winged helix-turn-helix transcriptional regulator [Paenibacillus cremeus]|uniref:MarR family transcriptional regulator n=1 Tax=Paenibacillus cremeus TaxID=2163881 RepID=A0A559K7R0_9BACL|nr:MarR family transcriptional regulator [Paenibacillus cremeus]TVY08123.1 MarR family transcriptional regulator [Paenibacillus cremeus]